MKCTSKYVNVRLFPHYVQHIYAAFPNSPFALSTITHDTHMFHDTHTHNSPSLCPLSPRDAHKVNHLSHFLMTLELLPLITETASVSGDGRIVLVSSLWHNQGTFDPANMNGEVSYGRVKFYGNSKLYNVGTLLFSFFFFSLLCYSPGNDGVCITEATGWCQHHCIVPPSRSCELRRFVFVLLIIHIC